MSLSVVIPTYNRARMVCRAIDSVRAQRHPPSEIIVVDDGSTDGTAALLTKRYGGAITLLRQENRGVAAARNSGVAAARGEWVAFLDSDDVWHPEKLQRQIAWHRENPQIEWSHTGERWIRNGREVRQKAHHAKPEGACFHRTLTRCTIAPSSVVIRRTLLEACGGFDEAFRVCEDFDLWLRLLRRHPVGLLEEALVTKHAGHTQLSESGEVMEYYRIRALLKHLPDTEVAAEIARKREILERGARRHANEAMLRFCAAVRRISGERD